MFCDRSKGWSDMWQATSVSFFRFLYLWSQFPSAHTNGNDIIGTNIYLVWWNSNRLNHDSISSFHLYQRKSLLFFLSFLSIYLLIEQQINKQTTKKTHTQPIKAVNGSVFMHVRLDAKVVAKTKSVNYIQSDKYSMSFSPLHLSLVLRKNTSKRLILWFCVCICLYI